MTDRAPSPSGDSAKSTTRFRKRGAQPIADLIGGLLGPAAKKRGFASVDLFAYWPDIVGSSFADYTQPERLNWPRRLDDGGEQGFEPATLTVRCEGSRALLLQYEERAVIERINAIFGFRAVAKLRIVQMPIVHFGSQRPKPLGPVSAATEQKLTEEVAGIADDGLRDALLKLGRAVKSTEAARVAKLDKQM
jgi:hypothetical protein